MFELLPSWHGQRSNNHFIISMEQCKVGLHNHLQQNQQPWM